LILVCLIIYLRYTATITTPGLASLRAPNFRPELCPRFSGLRPHFQLPAARAGFLPGLFFGFSCIDQKKGRYLVLISGLVLGYGLLGLVVYKRYPVLISGLISRICFWGVLILTQKKKRRCWPALIRT